MRHSVAGPFLRPRSMMFLLVPLLLVLAPGCSPAPDPPASDSSRIVSTDTVQPSVGDSGATETEAPVDPGRLGGDRGASTVGTTTVPAGPSRLGGDHPTRSTPTVRSGDRASRTGGTTGIPTGPGRLGGGRPSRSPEPPSDETPVGISGGPTMTDTYPAQVGVMSAPYTYCTIITIDDFQQTVKLVDISINSPFVLIQKKSVLNDCASTPSSDVPVCVAGNKLAAVHVGDGGGKSIGCRLGITLAEIPPKQQYSDSVRLTLTVACTDTAGPVCSDEGVVARKPAENKSVSARWRGEVPIMTL